MIHYKNTACVGHVSVCVIINTFNSCSRMGRCSKTVHSISVFFKGILRSASMSSSVFDARREIDVLSRNRIFDCLLHLISSRTMVLWRCLQAISVLRNILHAGYKTVYMPDIYLMSYFSVQFQSLADFTHISVNVRFISICSIIIMVKNEIMMIEIS